VSDKFQLASKKVTTLPAEPSPDIMLRLYALYKQSTLGDVQGRRPGRLDFRGRAKYDCWAYRRGMSREEAQQRYVNLVDDLLKRART
jgi:diazepam-binding inhibitor (GABA receptor modulator, acyl-CoA-binding protein)